MKIAELTAFHVRIPLRRPIRHASHTRTETDNVIVRCVLADKSEGFGEGLPREYVTGETIDSALELLKRSDLPSQFENCRDFAAVLQWAERLRLAPVSGDERQCQGNAARCAVELAVLDAYGRAFGEPLMNVTKMVAPELYQPRERVQYSGAIASARGWKLRLVAGIMRCYGFRQVKLKVGIPGYNDAKRTRSLRRIAGRKMDLRVDANESWSLDEAVEKIRALEPAGITSVEQPVTHENLSSLPGIRKQVRTPIMVDESLCSRVDAERAVSLQACDLFNLRLSKCGGFIPTLRLAQFARQNNLGYQLGCQVGETAILSAAGRHFATSVQGIRYLEGSYDRHLVQESLGQEDLTFRRGGWAGALVGCGLSFTVDSSALAAVTVRKESLFG
ncbi:MAG TPA: dipeptide epimerase [Gemmataceae bacterium]|jgi:muconate cycloisomerase|nr:dipeptide epimerase [Gemmataceae bacterium]